MMWFQTISDNKYHKMSNAYRYDTSYHRTLIWNNKINDSKDIINQPTYEHTYGRLLFGSAQHTSFFFGGGEGGCDTCRIHICRSNMEISFWH